MSDDQRNYPIPFTIIKYTDWSFICYIIIILKYSDTTMNGSNAEVLIRPVANVSNATTINAAKPY